MIERVAQLLKKGDLHHAGILLESERAENAQTADFHYLEGILAYYRGQIPESIEKLQNALKIDPHHTDAAICLSVACNDIGKYSDGERVFEIANRSVRTSQINSRTNSTLLSREDKEVNRKFSVKHMEIADLYFRYRRFDESIVEYSKAVELDPDTTEIAIRRARALSKVGLGVRAIQDLQDLKSKFPRDTAIRIQIGLLHFGLGNILEAELEWETVLDLSPGHREALGYLDMARDQRLKI